MIQKAKLLIVEDIRDVTCVSKTILQDMGYEVETCIKDGRAVLEAIGNYCPDVIIIEMFMANLDATATLRALSTQNLVKKPRVIVTSNYDNGLMQRDVLEAGADYFLLKPFDYDMLCERIDSLSNEGITIPRVAMRTPVSDIDLEVMVTNVLHHVGVPANIQGFHYLRTAILLAIDNEDILNRITKELYPSVAKIHKTTATRVERSIRHGIETAWDRGDVEVLASYFGYTVQSQKGKPTNSEFIALISDRIRLKIKIA